MEYSEDDLLRKWLLSDSLNFSRFFFQHQNNGKKFVIGKHHRLICDKLNLVLQGKIRRLLINIAPRYSKTQIAVKGFISNGLAINPASKFIHLSYSSNLALDNSIAIKNTVESEEFQRLFPMRIGMNRDTSSQWDTDAGGGVYATSSLGQVTGFGAGAVENEGETNPIFSGAIVIDDPIKPADALNENSREAVNRHFETTIRNRVNSRFTPIVVIMQRLHEQDLCGYLMSIEPDEWEVLSIPCLEIDDEGNETALWEFKHTVEELHKIEAANQFVFETQYMQNPKPLEGLMYSHFRTYETLPIEPGLRKNYTDTADSGKDFLCSVCYVEYKDAMYVTDVLYTDKPMEYTEPKTAEMLLRNGTILAKIESNNGGRGFCRNVEKAVRTVNTPLARKMMFVAFHQGGNKVTRILTRSAEVQNMIYFPIDWEQRWPQFARALKGYRKVGKNGHDDAPDVLTGMVEHFRKDTTAPIKGTPTRYSNERK
jgi:predicted phage terminase large subunit-like protein